MRTRRPRPAPAARSAFAGFRFAPDVIVVAVRWYLRFGLSYRDVEELLAEPGVEHLRPAPEDEERFLRAVTGVRRSRLRKGAVRWGLCRDGQNPRVFVELDVVPWWEEHMRQHTDRLTGADERFEEDADALSYRRPRPRTSSRRSFRRGSGRTPRSERGYPYDAPAGVLRRRWVDGGMEG